MTLEEGLGILGLWYLLEGIFVVITCIRPNLEVDFEEDMALVAVWTVFQMVVAMLVWPWVLCRVSKMKREGTDEELF